MNFIIVQTSTNVPRKQHQHKPTGIDKKAQDISIDTEPQHRGKGPSFTSHHRGIPVPGPFDALTPALWLCKLWEKQPTAYFVLVSQERAAGTEDFHTLGVVPKHSGWWHTERARCFDAIVAANQSRVIRRKFTLEFGGVAFTWKLRESSHLARTDCDDMNSTPPPKNDELVSERGTGLIHKCGGFSSDCANHKWLVVHDDINCEFCVSNLLMEPPATKMVQLPTERFQEVFMNQCNEDEAVLAQKNAKTIELSVVNLSEVWSTGAITPVFCTEYFIPFDSQTQLFPVDSVLILQTECGGRAFVVCICSWSHTMILQFPDASRPDKVHMVMYNNEKVTLSQMSERLYCLTRSPNTMEIWDCNNPTNPMRVVDHNFCCRLVCAHSGFLFHIGRSRITVTDYNLGSKVAVLRLSEMCGQPMRIANSFSFQL
ncbi:hypothetical protein Pelo_7861 [Pelomyxa schiedti]|nr:hypothetical protein Pelo_7861 [Pelomyxa schiedti]